MNPLNWTAIPFLELYVVLLVGAFVMVVAISLRLGKARVEHPPLTAVELAYLADGEQRVADTVVIGLLAAKAATLSADGRVIDIDAAQLQQSAPLAPFAALGLSGPMKRSDILEKLRPCIDDIRRRLENLGLSPNRFQQRFYFYAGLGLFAIPVGLGLAKLIIGIERHKPVGILAVLLFVTLFFGWGVLQAVPHSTRAGNQALAAQRELNARAARAPLDGELMLAVALTGLVVLSGGPYSALHAAVSASTGGGADGDGGGDGGGGCGGCGGGGD